MQPPRENHIQAAPGFPVQDKSLLHRISCSHLTGCWAFGHLCKPQWEPTAAARALLGTLPLLHALGSCGIQILMFHLLIFIQGKEHAQKDLWKQSIKWCRDGIVRKFWTASHPPCPCTKGDITKIAQRISDIFFLHSYSTIKYSSHSTSPLMQPWTVNVNITKTSELSFDTRCKVDTHLLCSSTGSGC